MVQLVTQKQRQQVRTLGFCYLCRKSFVAGDETDHDHVPPQSAFQRQDREPLKLKTHSKCNKAHSVVDEKIGQLVALRRQDRDRPPTNLRFRRTNVGTALWNLDVDDAVWRWISGFHAALYKEPLVWRTTGRDDPLYARSLVLPFPKGSKVTKTVDRLLPQHFRFVETIKVNRYLGGLDRIECNRGQLVYECTWAQYHESKLWFCVFALNVSDWKDLGALTPRYARGCAGHYMIEADTPPASASTARQSALILPNYDKADPFTA